MLRILQKPYRKNRFITAKIVRNINVYPVKNKAVGYPTVLVIFLYVAVREQGEFEKSGTYFLRVFLTRRHLRVSVRRNQKFNRHNDF